MPLPMVSEDLLASRAKVLHRGLPNPIDVLRDGHFELMGSPSKLVLRVLRCVDQELCLWPFFILQEA